MQGYLLLVAFGGYTVALLKYRPHTSRRFLIIDLMLSIYLIAVAVFTLMLSFTSPNDESSASIYTLLVFTHIAFVALFALASLFLTFEGFKSVASACRSKDKLPYNTNMENTLYVGLDLYESGQEVYLALKTTKHRWHGSFRLRNYLLTGTLVPSDGFSSKETIEMYSPSGGEANSHSGLHSGSNDEDQVLVMNNIRLTRPKTPTSNNFFSTNEKIDILKSKPTRPASPESSHEDDEEDAFQAPIFQVKPQASGLKPMGRFGAGVPVRVSAPPDAVWD